MKKRIFPILIILISITLAACGTNKTLTKSEVLTEASEAVANLKSYSIDMILNVNMMDTETKIEGTGDITHNPDTMHMTMAMGMPGMSMDFETYVNEDEAFMSMFGEWFTMSKEELGLESFDQLNKEQMDELARLSDKFEMTEQNNMYVLTLSGEGEEYSKILQPFIESSMGDFLDEPIIIDEMPNILVNSIDIELQIDKKTMIMMAQSIIADIDVDGEPMKLDGQFTISNINEVQPVEIPAEVRENAVDAFLFNEEPMSLEEIQEAVDFTIPQVTTLPEGFSLIDSWYDESVQMVTLNYEKDIENGFSLSIYPTEEAYGEIITDETTETVTINGNEGTLSDMDGFIILTWTDAEGKIVELVGGGPELTSDQFIQMAESVQ